MEKRLSVEKLSGWLATLATLATTNWPVVVGLVGGLMAMVFSWAADIAQNHTVQAGAGTFVVLLWTCLGIVVLMDRGKPRLVRGAQDYRYGLTFEGLAPSFDPENEEGILNFSIQLRNYSQFPIQYRVETFDVRFGSRALLKWKEGKTVYLPRGAGRTTSAIPFKKSDLQEFLGKRVNGTAEFSIVYGHPEEGPVRRLKVVIDPLVMGLSAGDLPVPPHHAFGANIMSEADEPFSIP